MFFIEEADKPNKLIDFFNIVRLEENKIILPYNFEKSNTKTLEKIIKKIEKIISISNVHKLVPSKKVINNEEFKNLLYASEKDIELVEGKWLFSLLLLKIIEFVIEKKKLEKGKTEISILVNDIGENDFENIKSIAKEYKKVNIITNHVEKFKKLEEKMMNENGILINLTNNKKKSLIHSKIIINIDFSNEIINKYKIFEQAIVISLIKGIKIEDKRYQGTVFIDYEIDYKKDEDDLYKVDKYYKKILYESKMYKKQRLLETKKNLKNDRVEIIELSSVRNVLK